MTTPTHHGETEPVPVVITNMPDMPQVRPRKIKHATVMTKNLTAAQPIQDLVPEDPSRLYVLAQAGGSNVVVCTDISQAQDPVNLVAGVPNANGLVLTAGNTIPFKIEGAQRMWIVGNTFPSQVTYVVMHERDM